MAWKWFKSSSSGVEDVAVAAKAYKVAISGQNGTIWRSSAWNVFTQEKDVSGFRRVAISPDGTYLYGVGVNGTIWESNSPNSWRRLEPANYFSSPVEDAAVNHDNSLWITCKNGQMWSMRDGVHWEWRTVLAPFKRLAVGTHNNWWGIDRGGQLYFRNGNAPGIQGEQWEDTKGSGMEDVSVSLDDTVWLVGSNGTVWKTRDGQSFTKIEASGFYSISAHGNDFVYATGINGTLWVYQTVPDPPPPGSGAGSGPSPSPATTQLHLNLGGYPMPIDGGSVTVKDVKWKVVPQWGAKAAVTGGGQHSTVTIPALPAGPAWIEITLDFTVVGDAIVNGQLVHQEAQSSGRPYPSRVDLSIAPMHVVGFLARSDVDQNGTPYFFSAYFGAQ